MDPLTIINNLLMSEEEDDKTAVKRQIGDFITKWDEGTSAVDQKEFHIIYEPTALSENEETVTLGPVKIELDLNSNEGFSSSQDSCSGSYLLEEKPSSPVFYIKEEIVVSSSQDSWPPSYLADKKPVLPEYSYEDLNSVRRLVLKICDISKYLMVAGVELEDVTEGLSVDLKSLKHLTGNSIFDDDSSFNDGGSISENGDSRGREGNDCDDDYKVDDDENSEGDDDEDDDVKDEDYQVEEEEEEDEESSESDEESSKKEKYSESEEVLESDDGSYEDNIGDDDWRPNRTIRMPGLVKRMQRPRRDLSKPEIDGLVESVDDDVMEETDLSSKGLISDPYTVTSPTCSKSESEKTGGIEQECIPTKMMTEVTSSNPSDDVKALKNHQSNGETKEMCENIAIKRAKKENSKSQAMQRNKRHKCTVCDKVFRSKYLYKVHFRIHTGERPFRCDVCGKSFMKGYTLKTHLQRHSGERPFKCLVCEKRFPTKFALSAHKLVHSDERRHKCHICGLAYKHKVGLKKHEKLVHDERAGAVSCSVCRRVFSSQEKLDSHKRLHLPQKRHGCKYCGKQLLFCSLIAHEKRCHTPRKSVQCHICGSLFKDKYYLASHMKRHGERSYLCQFCGKSWFSRSELTTHEKTHSLDRPHKCQFCEKTYTRNSHLRRHERRHTGVKSYKCSFCQECFFTLDSKVYHEKTRHLGIKGKQVSSTRKIPYRLMPKLHKCAFCDKKYASRSERNVHERERHTGLKPFSCNICGKKFSRKTRLNSHELKKHRERSSVKKADGETLHKTVRPQGKRRYSVKPRK